jgi:hypothetical protein
MHDNIGSWIRENFELISLSLFEGKAKQKRGCGRAKITAKHANQKSEQAAAYLKT